MDKEAECDNGIMRASMQIGLGQRVGGRAQFDVLRAENARQTDLGGRSGQQVRAIAGARMVTSACQPCNSILVMCPTVASPTRTASSG